MEWVLVVNNGPFEAAAWLFNKREFDDFKATNSDQRPRTYLAVPAQEIKKLFPDRYEELKS